MDPITIFGAATAASQVAGQGLSLSSYIFDLASKIRRAPQLMEDAALQVQLSAEALERLSETLEDQRDDLKEEYFNDAMLIVESCRAIYSEMRHRIAGEEKRSARGWKSRVRWAFRTDTKIAKLNGDLKVWEEVLRRHLSLPLYVEAFGKVPHRTSMARATLINGARSRRDQRLRAYFEREKERWREDRLVVDDDDDSLSDAEVPSHPAQAMSEPFVEDAAQPVPGPFVEEVDDDDKPIPMPTHPPDDPLAELPDTAPPLSNAAAAAIVAADLERYIWRSALPPDLLEGFDLSPETAARFHAPQRFTIISHSNSDTDSVEPYRTVHTNAPRPKPITTKPRQRDATARTHPPPPARRQSDIPPPRPSPPPNRPPIPLRQPYPRYPEYTQYTQHPEYSTYPDTTPWTPPPPPAESAGRPRVFHPAHPYEGYEFLRYGFPAQTARAGFVPYYGP